MTFSSNIILLFTLLRTVACTGYFQGRAQYTQKFWQLTNIVKVSDSDYDVKN